MTEAGCRVVTPAPIKTEDIKGLLQAPELPEGYVYVVQEAKSHYVRAAVVEIATGKEVMKRDRSASGLKGREWMALGLKERVTTVVSDLGESFLHRWRTDQETKAMGEFVGAWGGGAQ